MGNFLFMGVGYPMGRRKSEKDSKGVIRTGTEYIS